MEDGDAGPGSASVTANLNAAEIASPARPNIVFILADDLGYGDSGSSRIAGLTRVKTPNLDLLAKGGLRFLDGHSAAATCTPSRYALITGEYAFHKEGTNILPTGMPLVVPTDRATLLSILEEGWLRDGCGGKMASRIS